MPISRQAAMMRTAISPRLAIRIFLNMLHLTRCAALILPARPTATHPQITCGRDSRTAERLTSQIWVRNRVSPWQYRKRCEIRRTFKGREAACWTAVGGGDELPPAGTGENPAQHERRHLLVR